MTARVGLALLAVLRSDVSAARAHYTSLEPRRGLMIPTGLSTDRLLGLLAQTMGNLDQATAHFENALALCRKAGCRPELAWSCCDYADCLLQRASAAAGETSQPVRPEPVEGRGSTSSPRTEAQEQRQRAGSLLDEALKISSELGMRPLMERVLARKLELQGVASVDPSSASGGSGQALKTSIDAVASAVETERPNLKSHAAPDGTVTILFSDIEGYTEMTQRLGDRRAQQVLRGHNNIVRRQVAAYGGFEVKSLGDGFMLAFSSARRALQCAVAIQGDFAAHNRQHPQEPVLVRIGLHTGELVRETADFFGRNVILASRIADQARGGEILVSSLLKELTESGGDIRFGDEREVELRGLAGRHRVYPVVWGTL